MAIAVSAAAKTATTARLSAAIAVALLHVPDVVEARGVAEQAVAHEGECVGERQELRDPGQEARQGADREQRAGEEPGDDRDRGDAARCTPPVLGTRLASVSATPYMPT